jgi:predicted nucleotide-binding protein
VTLSGRTIVRLAAPFEGGSGPSHSTIENIWLGEDASAYLPSEGNKADRVRGGLKALRDGRAAGPLGPAVPPVPEKLQRVAEELAELLLSASLVTEDDVAEALGRSPATSPSRVVVASRSPSDAVSTTTTPITSTAPIFVVHGHDHGLLHQAVRVLERGTSREVVVLHEQANAGRTLLEKFEAHASEAAYAVVLLTPDDRGAVRDRDPQLARARQNVIFELGFFFGRLGRKRVAVLLAPGVEQPSDINGLVYIPVDAGGSWKYALARELAASGIPVAVDRIP